MKKPKRNKVKNVTIDGFDTMQELANHLHTTIDNIFASYLRQPITHDYVIKDQYIIHGNCALNKQECSYMVCTLSTKQCHECNVYKEYFKLK